jgi:hypothetical protein
MPSKYSKLAICLFVHDGNVLLSTRTLIQNKNRKKFSVMSLAHILAEDYEHDDDEFVVAKPMSLSSFLCSCIFPLLCF